MVVDSETDRRYSKHFAMLGLNAACTEIVGRRKVFGKTLKFIVSGNIGRGQHYHHTETEDRRN